MDENWRNYMSLTEKRIENILKAMKRAKDYHMKTIWNNKLFELLELKQKGRDERFESKDRVVH
jgi:hypothetical protein